MLEESKSTVRASRGQIQLRFDDETGELSIMDARRRSPKHGGIEARKEAMRNVGRDHKGDAKEDARITVRAKQASS